MTLNWIGLAFLRKCTRLNFKFLYPHLLHEFNWISCLDGSPFYKNDNKIIYIWRRMRKIKWNGKIFESHSIVKLSVDCCYHNSNYFMYFTWDWIEISDSSASFCQSFGTKMGQNIDINWTNSKWLYIWKIREMGGPTENWMCIPLE